MYKRTTSKPRSLPRPSAESDGLLHAIFDTAVEGIVIINDQGTIESFNRAAQQMFGYSVEQVVGQNVNILMPEPFRSDHDRYMERYLQGGRARIIGIGREIVAQRRDGTIFPMELAVSEVRAGNRRIFSGIIRDISERKCHERELLDISEREQQRIGYDLHDGLCQELAGIALLVQSIQQKINVGNQTESVGIDRVAALLQNTMARTRALAGGLCPINAGPGGLSAVLEQLIKDTRCVAGIRCTLRRTSGAEVRDPMIVTHLYRIAQSAVRDAARNRQATDIRLHLTERSGTITLTISDGGIGPSDTECFDGEMTHGLMKYRALAIGATLQVRPGRHHGIRVICKFPLQNTLSTTKGAFHGKDKITNHAQASPVCNKAAPVRGR